MQTPKVLIIYTGGTIGMVHNPATLTLEPFNFSQIQKNLPELKHINCEIHSHSLPKLLDSSNIEPQNWVEIAQQIEKEYNNYDAFVVLHGTDTMAFTTSALSFMLSGLQKPIVFTGSQLPIGDLRTDAKENLITSLQLASMQGEDGKALISEVCLYFQHRLFRGSRVSKINAEHFHAFDSPNFPPLAESGVHLVVNKDLLLKSNNEFEVNYKLSNDVFILHLFPGIKQEYVKQIFELKGLKGLIMLSFGSGNAPDYPWFLELIENATKKGITILNVTQCSKGAVEQGNYQVSEQLSNLGVISGKDITTEAAITKLMHLLGNNIQGEQLQKALQKPLRGEIS